MIDFISSGYLILTYVRKVNPIKPLKFLKISVFSLKKGFISDSIQAKLAFVVTKW